MIREVLYLEEVNIIDMRSEDDEQKVRIDMKKIYLIDRTKI